jgi:hypothetical protein
MRILRPVSVHPRLSRVLGTLLLATCATHGFAAERCVDSELQFDAILDAALASSNTVEDVRIKQGNFLFDSGQIGYFGVVQGSGKTLRISGGWSGPPGQCLDQNGGPSSSLLWGLGQRRVFALSASSTFTGSIVIENLTFGGGLSSTSSAPSCLALNEQSGGVAAIRVERVRVEACSTAAGFSSPAVSVAARGGLIVRNSLFAGNDSALSPPVQIAARNADGWVLNNTIVDNVSAYINGYVGFNAVSSDGGVLTLGNNLFDRNLATAGLRTDIRVVGEVRLRNNRYTRLWGTPIDEVGSSTGAAGFASNDYELARTSTARDAGAFFVPSLQGATDVVGQVRVQGTAVDLGAFEYSEVFADGFE